LILNAWSVATGFLAIVGIVLGAAGLVVAARALVAGGARSALEPGADASVDRARLAFLIGGVLLIVRFLAWPLFYGTLKSFVPELSTQGVMCAFGVTRIDPARVHALEFAKPLVLALLGAGWILTAAPPEGSPNEAAAVRRVRLVLLALAGGLAVFECGLELAWLFADKGGREVTCCSTFFGSEAARVDASIGPLASLRELGPVAELGLLFGGGAATIAAALWLRRSRGTALAVVALAVFTLIQVPVAVQVWVDVVAPSVLGLPYHHCPYELVTETLALGPAAAMGVLGRAALALPAFGLLLAKSAPLHAFAARRRALGLGALWLGSELLITTVHLL